MKKTLLLSLVVGLVVNLSMAQAPNDNCADAIEVMLDELVAFSTINATTDGPFHPNSPCPSSESDSIFSDIWYTYTANFSGDIVWSLCGMADYDSRIGVYNAGATCPLTDDDLLDCNEDGPAACTNFESELEFTVVEGQTYLMRLGGFGGAEPGAQGTGSFTLSLALPGPANDDCADAIEIGLGEDQEVTNIDATTDGPDHPNDQICFGFGDMTAQNDIWFTFTAPYTGWAEWSTCDQVNWDSRMVIYGPNVSCVDASPDNMVACNDATGGCANFTNILQWEVTQGDVYLMRLGGFAGETGVGVFDLVEYFPPLPPVNDVCATPDTAWIMTKVEADDFDFIFPGNTENSTISPSFVDPTCGTGQGGEYPDIWFKFNSAGLDSIEVRFIGETEGAGFFWEMFEDCNGIVDTSVISNSCIRYDPDDPLLIDTIIGLPSTPTDYWVRVSSWVFWPEGEFWFQLVHDGILNSTDEPVFVGETSVFPNPVAESLNLNFNLIKSVDTQIEIVNSLGQNIYSEDFGRLQNGNQTLEFDTSPYAPGIYFLIIQTEGVERSMKFIKE